MIYGKLIGGFIGLLTGGPLGLLIGIVIGHYFDRALAGHSTRSSIPPVDRQEIEATFFRTVFLLMGRLAKVDGRISEAEVAHTENLMAKMALNSEHRQQAIALFKEGAEGGFVLEAEILRFRNRCGRHPALVQQLLNYLLALCLADGQLSNAEEDLLRKIALNLGISNVIFDQFLRMVRAQTHFRSSGGGYRHRPATPAKDELALAYDALGVDSKISDGDLKKAYRKLMSENHPDKLMGQGVPEDMIKLATERVQEIQTAYELIKSQREK